MVALAGVSLVLAGCRHGPDPKQVEGAHTHYQLGVLAQQNGNIPEAYRELKQALDMDDANADAHLAMGLLMQFSYAKPDAAEREYLRAIQLRPEFTEAKVNLGTVYLQQGAYERAIPLFKEALNDMAYRTPYIAESDLGWALYKSGQVEEGVNQIKSAVTTNPGWCLGYRQLGDIATARGDLAGACRAFHRFQDACPQTADASWRVAVCEAKLGNPDASRTALEACVKAKDDAVKVDECRTKLEQASGRSALPPPATPAPMP
jgi:type IV pilus biogenesis/stability protein PilW